MKLKEKNSTVIVKISFRQEFTAESKNCKKKQFIDN
jgi:hypothetical protein